VPSQEVLRIRVTLPFGSAKEMPSSVAGKIRISVRLAVNLFRGPMTEYRHLPK